MPTMDEGDIIIGVEKLPSISLEESAALDLRMQQAIMAQVPEVKGVVARAGSDELGLDPMGLNQTDTFLVLKPQRRMAQAGQGMAHRPDARGAQGFPGHCLQLHPADRHAGVGNDHRVARRCRGEDFRPRSAHA